MERRQFLTLSGSIAAGLSTGAWSWPLAKKRPPPVLIAGSTNVLPFTKLLLQAFLRHHPDIEVVSEGGGSLAGLIAVRRGAIDIAAMSREIRRNEQGDSTRDYLLAKDAIALICHPANRVRAVKRAHIRDILAGRIQNWAVLGGDDAPLHLYNRAAGSTTRRWVEENIMGGDDVYRQAPVLAKAKDVADAVAKDPLAIGYLATRDLTTDLPTLKIDGVEISRPSIYSGRYPLTRSLYYVAHGTTNESARLFLTFARSAEAQALLEPELLRVY